MAVDPPGGRRTWVVLDQAHATVAPVEEWLEAHRMLWSPNTVRAYAAALAQWWSFLEQGNRAGSWDALGVPEVGAFLSWLRNGRVMGRQVGPVSVPSQETLQARLAAVISFYRWQDLVHAVPVASRLLRGAPARMPARGLLAHLQSRLAPAAASLVKVRRVRRDRPPVLVPAHVQAILDGCAVPAAAGGGWVGNLRDRMLFALLAETGMRLGEALGMRVGDFVMGRGGTAHVEVVPREDNANGARVKMMRPRRVYVGADLERLFADYLTHLACRAAELGMPVDAFGPLFVNLDRPPYLSPLRAGVVREKIATLRSRGVGPKDWTAHWFRHTHATALLLGGTPEWVVSRRLGHAHVQTTMDLYGWVSEDAALRAAANWRSYTNSWDLGHGR